MKLSWASLGRFRFARLRCRDESLLGRSWLLSDFFSLRLSFLSSLWFPLLLLLLLPEEVDLDLFAGADDLLVAVAADEEEGGVGLAEVSAEGPGEALTRAAQLPAPLLAGAAATEVAAEGSTTSAGAVAVAATAVTLMSPKVTSMTGTEADSTAATVLGTVTDGARRGLLSLDFGVPEWCARPAAAAAKLSLR